MIRVWSAGCASGEEAYSLAMLLAEALGPEQFRQRVKIYATDVDEEALSKARIGIYSKQDVEYVPPELLEKYFDSVNGSYSFRKEFRRCLIFGRNDLTQDAPISRLDLLICRNTLMYFNSEAQAKILARFHFALRERGFLFLGKAETLLTQTQVFVPVNIKHRLFRKAAQVNLRDRLLLMAETGESSGMNGLLGLVRLREAALETSPLPQVVVDPKGRLLVANAEARNLFALRPEDMGRPLHELSLSYYINELSPSLDRVLSEGRAIKLGPAPWNAGTSINHHMEINLQPLFDNGTVLVGTCISFMDVSNYIAAEKQLEKANQELATSMEELQATMEEMETTQEELQSSMEEVETTNEELQSANEELETMNEELQSVNEELQTVNEEMRRKTEDLHQLNLVMDSILSSIRMGMVVLDPSLSIMIWNRQAENMWGLRVEEVVNQHFLNLDSGLPVDALHAPLRACLSGKEKNQEVVLQARNRRGQDILCKVFCTPLIGPNRGINGVVVLMEELSE